MKYTQQDLDCPQQVNCPQQVKNQKLTHDIPNESKQFKKIPLSTDINHLDHIKEDDVSKVVPLVIKSNVIFLDLIMNRKYHKKNQMLICVVTY